MKNTGVIILAAGASRRLGEPKQLLSWQGQPLLQHIIDQTSLIGFGAAAVVLGAHAATILPAINSRKFEVIINDNWEEGMASSIRKGMEHNLAVFPKMEQVLLLLSDQPFVSQELLERLLALHGQSGKKISACQYGDIIGAPAVFSKAFFPELQLLQGDRGAGKLIQRYPEEVAILPFAQGGRDIDTKEDYFLAMSFFSDER